eukprot:UN2973
MGCPARGAENQLAAVMQTQLLTACYGGYLATDRKCCARQTASTATWQVLCKGRAMGRKKGRLHTPKTRRYDAGTQATHPRCRLRRTLASSHGAVQPQKIGGCVREHHSGLI